MRVRPQSYLLPAALLICLFFYTKAFSEKKNSVYRGDAVKGVNFYNADYKKRAAKGNGDITPDNSTNRKKENSVKSDSEKYSTYVVKKGDTLFSISKKSAVSLKKLQDMNNLNENSTIYTGMKLLIGGSKVSEKSGRAEEPELKRSDDQEEYITYTVKKGDTVFSIAKKADASVKTVQGMNGLNDNTKLYRGMKLKIPSAKKISISKGNLPEKRPVSSKPLFLWPLKKVKRCSRDGKDGVKAIGVFIKGNPGSDVIASEDGVVKKVGYMRGYGKYIVVKHEKSYITVYSNLMQVDVKAGDTVEKGGRIGNISDDMTLHFQIDRRGKPENPLDFLPDRG